MREPVALLHAVALMVVTTSLLPSTAAPLLLLSPPSPRSSSTCGQVRGGVSSRVSTATRQTAARQPFVTTSRSDKWAGRRGVVSSSSSFYMGAAGDSPFSDNSSDQLSAATSSQQVSSQSSSSSSSSPPPQQNKQLHELYLTVAQQDPQWLQTYVVDILGPDEVDDEILHVLQQSVQEQKASKQEEEKSSITSQPIEPPSPASLSSSSTARSTSSLSSSGSSSSSSSTSAATTAPDTTSTAAVEFLVVQATPETLPQFDTSPSFSGDSDTSDNNKDDDDGTELPIVGVETLKVLPDDIDIVLTSDRLETSNASNDSSQSDVAYVSEDDDDDDSKDEEPVSDLDSPLEEDGTTVVEESTEETRPDHPNPAVLGQTDDTTRTNPYSLHDDGEDPTAVSSQSEQSQVQKDEPKSAASNDTPGENSNKSQDSKPTSSAAQQDVEAKSRLTTDKRASTSKPFTRREDNPAGTQPSPSNDRVVVCWDSLQKRWSNVNLTQLVKLGYTETELVSLQPLALDLIAQDAIRRPRSGIPSRWKTGSTTDSSTQLQLVHIVPRTEVDSFVKEQEQRRRRASVSGSANSTRSTTKSPRSSTPPDVVGDRMRREVSRTRDRDSQEQRTRRSRQDRLEDGRPKRIYNGRPTKSDAFLDDPPPSSSGIWPDMDSFRNMLRNEAALRLRILGDDWSGVVKEESDWRLDLYKKWLWTLHNGVGDPIVESRSDRMRRLGRMSANPARRPPPNTTIRSSRERNRPNTET